MRILSLYTPINRTIVISTRLYHSANFSGGGLLGSTASKIPPYYSKPTPRDPEPKPLEKEANPLANPRSIVQHLDDYVIGQVHAKKILAVAIFNHYNRVRANTKRQQARLQKQRQFKKMASPAADKHIVIDERIHPEHHHPSLPQDYYVSTQLPLDDPNHSAQQRRPWLNPPSVVEQEEELIIEDNEVGIIESDSVVHDKSNVLLIGPTGSGKTLLARTLAQVLQVPFSMSDATPFTQAGYVGDDVELVIQRLLQACDYDVKKAETGIVFIDEIDKISRKTDASGSGSRDVSGEGVQQSLLRMLEGTVVNVTDKSAPANHPNTNNRRITGSSKGETYSVDTSNILFILSGAFVGLEKMVGDRLSKGSIGFGAVIKSEADIEREDSKSLLSQVEPTDLVKFGLIPEFVGRLPVLANVNNLQVEDLVRVLKEPKNSLLKQYEGLFNLNHVQLRFSESALKAIAVQALEKKTGARGLRRIMENLLLDSMFDTPGSCIKQVVIDSKVVNKEKQPVYISSEDTQLADKIIAEDDGLGFYHEDDEQQMRQM